MGLFKGRKGLFRLFLPHPHFMEEKIGLEKIASCWSADFQPSFLCIRKP